MPLLLTPRPISTCLLWSLESASVVTPSVQRAASSLAAKTGAGLGTRTTPPRTQTPRTLSQLPARRPSEPQSEPEYGYVYAAWTCAHATGRAQTPLVPSRGRLGPPTAAARGVRLTHGVAGPARASTTTIILTPSRSGARSPGFSTHPASRSRTRTPPPLYLRPRATPASASPRLASLRPPNFRAEGSAIAAGGVRAGDRCQTSRGRGGG